MKSKFENAIRQIAEILGVELKEEKETSGQEATQQTPEETIETKLSVDSKLDDGSILNFDPAIEQGAMVLKIQEDGTVAPLENGIYTLENGTSLEITDGTVSAIMAPANSETEQETNIETETELSAEETIKSLNEKITVLEKILQAHDVMINEIAGKVTQTEAIQTKLSAVVQTIADLPAEKPLTRTESFSASASEKETKENNDINRLFKNKEAKSLENIFKAIK